MHRLLYEYALGVQVECEQEAVAQSHGWSTDGPRVWHSQMEQAHGVGVDSGAVSNSSMYSDAQHNSPNAPMYSDRPSDASACASALLLITLPTALEAIPLPNLACLLIIPRSLTCSQHLPHTHTQLLLPNTLYQQLQLHTHYNLHLLACQTPQTQNSAATTPSLHPKESHTSPLHTSPAPIPRHTPPTSSTSARSRPTRASWRRIYLRSRPPSATSCLGCVRRGLPTQTTLLLSLSQTLASRPTPPTHTPSTTPP